MHTVQAVLGGQFAVQFCTGDDVLFTLEYCQNQADAEAIASYLNGGLRPDLVELLEKVLSNCVVKVDFLSLTKK